MKRGDMISRHREGAEGQKDGEYAKGHVGICEESSSVLEVQIDRLGGVIVRAEWGHPRRLRPPLPAANSIVALSSSHTYAARTPSPAASHDCHRLFSSICRARAAFV